MVFVIASNITTRNPEVDCIFKSLQSEDLKLSGTAARELKYLAGQCIEAGADAIEINLQQHEDQPETMRAAVKIIQEITDRPLCLSTNKAEVLEAGIEACQTPPIINYISLEEARLRDMFPLIARHHARVVLLVSTPDQPADAREMLAKAAILVGAAYAADIPNEHIIIDPGLIHITLDGGQRHLAEIREFLKALPDAFEPPVHSTCWLANASSGARPGLRSTIESALFTYAGGVGAFLGFLGCPRPRPSPDH